MYRIHMIENIRSIPAGAGEPSMPPTRIASITVYPRGCGGTAAVWPFALKVVGLSPRVRGNL